MLAIYERKEVGVSLCVCFNKDEKSIQVVIFIFFFRFVSFLVRLCMGLRFFLFCSWFFGLARGLYLCLVILSMVGGSGGGLLLFCFGGGSGTVANMRPNFFSHTSIEMRKVL